MLQSYIPKRAMFIYAHPDDIEFGVAGTAAKWANGGSEITYVVITDGNVGIHEDGISRESLGCIRRFEQEKAAEIAGVKRCLFLGKDDGFLQPTLELRKELVRLIRMHRPNVVVCGDPASFFPNASRINHPDHRAAATAAIEAVFPACEMRLLYPDLLEQGYEPHKVNYVCISHPQSQKPNLYIDISETIEIKLEALRQHASQLGDWDPSERLRQWASEIGGKVGFAYAEQFLCTTLKVDEPEEE